MYGNVCLDWIELNIRGYEYNKFTMELKPIRLATLLLSLSSLIPTTAALDCFSHNGTIPPITSPSPTTIHPSHQNILTPPTTGVNANSSEFYDSARDGSLIACGTGATTCCLESEYCDVDLLCHSRSNGGYSRQYCSDPDWPEDACSQLCPSTSPFLPVRRLCLHMKVLGMSLWGKANSVMHRLRCSRYRIDSLRLRRHEILLRPQRRRLLQSRELHADRQE